MSRLDDPGLATYPLYKQFPGSGSATIAAATSVASVRVPHVTKELVEIQRHEALADEPEHPGKQVGAGRFRNSVQRHDD